MYIFLVILSNESYMDLRGAVVSDVSVVAARSRLSTTFTTQDWYTATWEILGWSNKIQPTIHKVW